MATNPRVVAELGRPETADETAARKAESSRIYRSSQSFRNLIAALIITVAVVVVIIFAVPRGTPPEREPVDVAAVAESVASSEGRTAIVPDIADDWFANRASIESDGTVRAWTVIYAPLDEDERGFLRVAQGFGADEAWTARMLSGAAPEETVTIGGVEWDRYELDPENTANISVALSAEAGQDTVLIYGSASEEMLDSLATSVADQVIDLREETE